MATVCAVIASTHHPFYYRASTATGADRPPFADEWVAKIERVPGDADPGPAGRAGDGRQRPLPPVVAGQHAAVPGRQGAVLRRQLVQRGARVRPAADDGCTARRTCPRTSCGTAWTRTSTWRSATSCGSTTASPARSSPCGPQADLPIVPIYTNIFAPPLPQPQRFVAARPGDPRDGRVAGRRTCGWRSSAPATCRWSWAARASSAQHGPDPEFDRKAVEWIATGDLDGCLAEVTLDSLHAPGNATHGFMDFMLMMGVAGDGVEGRPRRHPRPVPHHGGLLHLVSERSPTQ